MNIRGFAAALGLLVIAACSDVGTAPEAAGHSPAGASARPQSSSLYVSIDGPGWVTYGPMSQPGPYYQWTAQTYGGNGSYTYDWVVSDVLGRTWAVGSGPVFGTNFDCRWVNFTLTVNVSSGGQWATSSAWVEGLGDGQCEY